MRPSPIAESPILPLEHRFPEEICLLSELFGKAEVRRSLPRLNELHAYAEAKWREYVEQIPDGRINYLLIAEAPPWSAAGQQIQYVLDPSSHVRTLMRALREALLPHHRQLTLTETLAEFARTGFLIVDSLPFAMGYSSNQRKTAKYEDLVRLTVERYLQEAVSLPPLTWPPNVRIAFSVKLNALAIMKVLGHRLKVGQTEIELSPNLIAVNGAGYPDSKRLRELYGLAL